VQNRQNADCGSISQKSRDLFARFPNNPNNELFSNGKSRALGARPVDQGRTGGAPWTHGGADRGHGGALTGACPPAAPVHGSSPAGAQKREGNVGNSAQATSGLGRRRGGWATAVQNGEEVALGERIARAGRGGNRSRERCSEAQGGCSPFIGAGGALGRGGRGG
jgi:hypothetical protein